MVEAVCTLNQRALAKWRTPSMQSSGCHRYSRAKRQYSAMYIEKKMATKRWIGSCGGKAQGQGVCVEGGHGG
jgi:hypothetical protein